MIINKPKAYNDSIKKAAIMLSYAYDDIPNEGIRHEKALHWESKLQELIKEEGYQIITTEPK